MVTVKQIQEQLNKLGFGPLTVDGVRGTNTTNAIKNFQKLKGLTADGVVGPKTLEKLFTTTDVVTVEQSSSYKDTPTLNRIKLLHPKLRDEALSIYNDITNVLSGKVTVRFTFTLRTFAEQQALYNQGRTKPGPIVTNARAGLSFHNYGLAIDIALLIDKNGDGVYDEVKWDTIGDYDGDRISDWMECVRVFKKYGWVWGADWDNDGITKAQGDKDENFVDAPHFQKTFGYTTSTLLKRTQDKKIDKYGYPLL